MSPILITGGAGYIGSHTVHAFRDAGYEVVVIDNLSTGARETLPPDVRLVVADVGDREAVDALLAEVCPSGLLHFAGSIIVPESMVEPGHYYRNNVVSSLTLFEACLRHGVRHVVFSSSAAVYGVPAGGRAAEDAPQLPINPYGWSKLMTEQMLADLSRAHGLTYAALRYFNVAGADSGMRTGQPSPQGTHLIKVACEVATGHRECMYIYGTDYPTRDGTCIRDYVHVTDLAEAHLMAFEHIRRNDTNQILNCGNGDGVSVREVIAAVNEVVGRPIAISEGERRPGDPPEPVAEAQRIRKVLGWRPCSDDLRVMVETALRWEEILRRRIAG